MTYVRKVEAWRSHLGELRCLVHRIADPQVPSEIPAAIEAAKELGMKVFRIDGNNMQTRDAAMQHLADVFQFPDWFGRNWDAVFDLLSDLSWHEHRGVLVIVEDKGCLRHLPSTERRKFAEVLAHSAKYWRYERGEYDERSSSLPFHIILVVSDLRETLSEEMPIEVCGHTPKEGDPGDRE